MRSRRSQVRIQPRPQAALSVVTLNFAPGRIDSVNGSQLTAILGKLTPRVN